MFEIVCAALLTYFGVLLVVKVSWASVAVHTLVPHVTLSAGYLTLLVAVLGTTTAPISSGSRRTASRSSATSGGRR